MNARWVSLALALSACTVERAPATSAVSSEPPAGMIGVPGQHFFLDRTPVTVGAWRASGLPTTAERLGGQVMVLGTGTWRVVPGATYERPRGPEGSEARDDEPATQISWDDATAFCAARGARLPTEAEWEAAARNGRGDRSTYPWGDEPTENGRWLLNAWQGSFPTTNSMEDGFLFASPVGSFPPTPIGLMDMVGNVWQWTSDRFAPDDPNDTRRAMRGGSYLCDEVVCHGYRIEARQGATPDSALMHVGFRCAADAR
jgi:sulfatase modifying factor 1